MQNVVGADEKALAQEVWVQAARRTAAEGPLEISRMSKREAERLRFVLYNAAAAAKKAAEPGQGVSHMLWHAVRDVSISLEHYGMGGGPGQETFELWKLVLARRADSKVAKTLAGVLGVKPGQTVLTDEDRLIAEAEVKMVAALGQPVHPATPRNTGMLPTHGNPYYTREDGGGR